MAYSEWMLIVCVASARTLRRNIWRGESLMHRSFRDTALETSASTAARLVSVCGWADPSARYVTFTSRG